MKHRIALAAGWGIALFALIGIAKLPGHALDLYFKDTYVVASKHTLVAAVVVVMVLPLAVATIRRARAAR